MFESVLEGAAGVAVEVEVPAERVRVVLAPRAVYRREEVVEQRTADCHAVLAYHLECFTKIRVSRDGFFDKLKLKKPW